MMGDGLPSTDLISAVLMLRQSSAESVITGVKRSDFQDLFRIPHRIEEYLVSLVRNSVERPAERRYDLIVLAGNAGDGKSHLLSAVMADLQPGQVEFIADATHTEHPSVTLSQQLMGFFAPFAGGAQPPEKLHVIAMNTGAVLRFFDSMDAQDQSRFASLKTTLYGALQLPGHGSSETNQRILVINLDMRRLLGLPGDTAEHSFFRQMIRLLNPADGPLVAAGEACDQCPNAGWCFVHFNLTALQNPVVQENLETLLWQVQLAGVHLSPRNLWDFLSRLVTGGEDFFLSRQSGSPCDVVADLRHVNGHGDPLGLFRRLFFNLLFNDDAPGDAHSSMDVALREIDPASLVSKGAHELTSEILVRPGKEADRFRSLVDVMGHHPVLETLAAWAEPTTLEPPALVMLADGALRRRHLFLSPAPAAEPGKREATADERDLADFLKLLGEYRQYVSGGSRMAASLPDLNRFPAEAGELFGQVFGRRSGGRLYIQLEGLPQATAEPVLVEVPAFERGALGYRVDPRFPATAEPLLEALQAIPHTVKMQLGSRDTEPIHFDLTLTMYRMIQRVRRGYQASTSELSDLFHLRYAIQRWARYRAEQGSDLLVKHDGKNYEGFRTATGMIKWNGGDR